MLKFIGSGSAFNTKLGNNSAYYKNGSNLLLIDCGTTVFSEIKENNLLDGIDDITVLITHCHDDHVGSLASLILYTFYSHGEYFKSNINPTIRLQYYDVLYIDTCKADYPGNVHLSLRELCELVPFEYRHKVWCMHLDEGFDRVEAEELGFNVVKNEF